MRLTDFKVLSFDCYGTLIDWEAGIYAALGKLLARAQLNLTKDQILEVFAQYESRQETTTPDMRYCDLLGKVYEQLAALWHVQVTEVECQCFGNSVTDWPAFADSPSALQYLKQHYMLVILSNVDRRSFRGSNARLGVVFDAIYTAEEIGSYKPSLRNFEYMIRKLEAFGITKSDILHTAQSLFHDHVPANEIGLSSAWIDRRHDVGGWGATMPPPKQAKYNFRFNSLGMRADAHRCELGGLSAAASKVFLK